MGRQAPPGIMRETSLVLPWVLGSLALALLVTLAVVQTGSNSLIKGFKVGAMESPRRPNRSWPAGSKTLEGL